MIAEHVAIKEVRLVSDGKFGAMYVKKDDLAFVREILQK